MNNNYIWIYQNNIINEVTKILHKGMTLNTNDFYTFTLAKKVNKDSLVLEKKILVSKYKITQNTWKLFDYILHLMTVFDTDKVRESVTLDICEYRELVKPSNLSIFKKNIKEDFECLKGIKVLQLERIKAEDNYETKLLFKILSSVEYKGDDKYKVILDTSLLKMFNFADEDGTYSKKAKRSALMPISALLWSINSNRNPYGYSICRKLQEMAKLRGFKKKGVFTLSVETLLKVLISCGLKIPESRNKEYRIKQVLERELNYLQELGAITYKYSKYLKGKRYLSSTFEITATDYPAQNKKIYRRKKGG